MLKLNSKGKLAKFYMWLPPDDKQLPQDFCTYFWGLVGRAIFIFIFGGMFAAVIGGAVVLGIIYGSRFLWSHKEGTLFTLGMFLFVGLIMWLSERKTKIKIEILSEAKMIIKGKVDAVKNRYCPRIDWK